MDNVGEREGENGKSNIVAVIMKQARFVSSEVDLRTLQVPTLT